MSPISLCLTPERLRQLRDDQVSPAGLEEIEQHLGECAHCQKLIEDSAAETLDWADVRESLSTAPDAIADEFANLAGDSAEAYSLPQLLKLLGPTDDPRMLGRIGTYEIVGLLGSGGMGAVFKGFDAPLNRYVAIKMLLPHLAASGAARKRFAREAQAAAAVVDEHVMAIHGVAEWQGVPYLVMPYSRGETLQKRINDNGPLELREILRIGLQTAAGLAAAHAQGLVHRDVKPANILLDDGVERVTLTDFGLARAVDDIGLTRTGTLAGTPQYMSPEQARGQAVDARSDLFSLGSVLYATCTGRAPFRADSSYGVLRLITDDEPRAIRELNPDIPLWLCEFIARLMAKQPEHRFASAAEVRDHLERCLAHVQQPTTVPAPKCATKPALHQKRPFQSLVSRGILAMTALMAAGLISLAVMQATEPPDIAGTWSGTELGVMELKLQKPGQYAGSYTETHNAKPGEVRLKWSRLEQRFNGSWKEGADCHGEISVRLVKGEIHGAFLTDDSSTTGQKVKPHLGELHCVRGAVSNADEYTRFEGTWRILQRTVNEPPEAGEFGKDGTVVIKDRRMGQVEIRLDGTKQPRQFDLIFKDGPEKGKVLRGIYEWDTADKDDTTPRPRDGVRLAVLTDIDPDHPELRPRDFKEADGVDSAMWERVRAGATPVTPDATIKFSAFDTVGSVGALVFSDSAEPGAPVTDEDAEAIFRRMEQKLLKANSITFKYRNSYQVKASQPVAFETRGDSYGTVTCAVGNKHRIELWGQETPAQAESAKPSAIPKGMRVATFEAPRQDFISQLRPGDRLDVEVETKQIVSGTLKHRLVLQYVRVFAISRWQPIGATGDAAAPANPSVSVLVTEDQAQRLMLAKTQGAFRVALYKKKPLEPDNADDEYSRIAAIPQGTGNAIRTFVSNGTRLLRLTGPEREAVLVTEPTMDHDATLRQSLARQGVLSPGVHGADLVQMRTPTTIRGFEFRGRERLGERPVIAIHYQLASAGLPPMLVTLWLDPATDLPLMRMLSVESAKETVFVTEVYSDFVFDQKFDDAQFVRPESTEKGSAPPIPANTDNPHVSAEAYVLFREMEQQITTAKTVKLTFSGIYEGTVMRPGPAANGNESVEMRGDLTGSMAIAQGNRLRLEIGGAEGAGAHPREQRNESHIVFQRLLDKAAAKRPAQRIEVSDGKRFAVQRSPQMPNHPIEPVGEPPAELEATSRLWLSRLGALGSVIIKDLRPDTRVAHPVLPLADQLRINRMSLEQPARFGNQEALVIQFTLEGPLFKEVSQVTLWLNPQTKLPMMRKVSLKLETSSLEITEVYPSFVVDKEIADSKFDTSPADRLVPADSMPPAKAVGANQSGLVTLKGKPVEGKISFHLDDGSFVGATVNEAGRFTVKNIPPGKYKVTVEGEGVPPQYTRKETTPLVVELKAEAGTFNFELP